MDSRRVRGIRESHRGFRADRRGALALSRYCLDTSAYSQLRRGEPQVTELVDEADWLGLPAVVLGELFRGFLSGRHRATNEDALIEFLAEPVVEEIPIDRDVARIYAEIVISLKRAGTPLPTNDAWVAAATARVGAPLLTFDEHFRAVGRIGTILLRPAPG